MSSGQHPTTGFYNRTPFCYLKIPLPTPLLDVDAYLVKKYRHPMMQLASKELMHAENLCRRYGDVLYLEQQTQNTLNLSNVMQAAVIAPTFLTAYLSAAKSLLDAVAIMLDDVRFLQLKPKERDFAKAIFWKTFETKDLARALRYDPLKPWFKDVIVRRESAVHRVVPFLVATGPGDPTDVPPPQMKVMLVNRADVTSPDIMQKGPTISKLLVPPDDIFRARRPNFEQLITLACEDLPSP